MAEAAIGTLKEISFFADLSDYDLVQIAAITKEKSYRAGEAIIEERTAAERFFIIVRGKIEISKRFADGEQLVLAVHSNGEFFGEMALLDEGPRSATVRAVEPTTVLEISRPDFETLLYKAPVLAYRILRELGSRLRETGALLVSHLEKRNRQIYRAYLDTLTVLLEKAGSGDPRKLERVQRRRTIAGSLGRELGLQEEELLVLEIGVILSELDIAAHPALLKARPGPLARRIIAMSAACEAAVYEHPEPTAGELRRKAGKGFDPQIAEAFLRLRRSGRL